MHIYDFYNDEDKNFINENCPYKIGDRIKVTRIINKSHDVRIDTWEGTVIDVYIHVRDINEIFGNTHPECENFIKFDSDGFNKFAPHFGLTFQYEELQPRSKWWKIWEERTYKPQERNVTVNYCGDAISTLKGVIDYIIEKNK